jgi:hypothetical protein
LKIKKLKIQKFMLGAEKSVVKTNGRRKDLHLLPFSFSSKQKGLI